MSERLSRCIHSVAPDYSDYWLLQPCRALFIVRREPCERSGVGLVLSEP